MRNPKFMPKKTFEAYLLKFISGQVAELFEGGLGSSCASRLS
jgi:hypothetical protein